MNTKTKGYILGIIAAAAYGMTPLFALPLYKAGMNPDSVLFFRYLFAIPVLGIMIKARGRNFKLQRKEVLPLVIMGLLVALSSLALFLSYNYMEAGIASTLLFVYPIMVALIMAFVFKEKLTLLTISCILLALVGIGLLYKTSSGSTLSTTGIILVMVSALSYAIYIVGVNRSILKEIATLKLTFYILLFGMTLFFGTCRFREKLTHCRCMVSLGEFNSPGYFPDSHILPLYYSGCSIYRIYSDCNSRSIRTPDRRFFRSNRFRGGSDSKIMLRNINDYFGCNPYYRRRKYNYLYGSFQENVS